MALKQDNIDKIYLRIEALRQYVAVLEDLKNISYEDLKSDAVKRGAVERYLQLAIEACIDIAELIISDQRLVSPTTYKEAIYVLGKEKILDEEFAKKFSEAAGFRNILIHDYVKIDYKRLHSYLQNNLSDFHRFIKEILGCRK